MIGGRETFIIAKSDTDGGADGGAEVKLIKRCGDVIGILEL